MARLRAFVAFDMSGTGADGEVVPGEIVYADRDLVVVDFGGLTEIYHGDFTTHPNEDWEGEVHRIEVYDWNGALLADLRGIEIDTRVVGFDLQRFAREAFRGDDRMAGSRDDDVLIGFNGDDVIRGSVGEDVLEGRRGADALRGGLDDDALRGGLGRDVLAGGRGDDALRGEEGRDVFVFGARDGNDVVRDFRNRRDKIEIEDGASDFDALEIVEVDGDAVVAFARTEIVLRDIDVEDLGRGDFLFV